MNKERKKYYDTDTADEVVARVYQEERAWVDDIRLRVVRAQFYARSRVSLDGWEYNRYSSAEKVATENAFGLAEDGYDLIIWISPNDGEIYKEGRLNIMIPVKDKGELGFDPWGVPLLIGQDESKKLADRLLEVGGVSMDPIYDVDSLRCQPIGYKLEDGAEWLQKCRELMPEFKYIWDYIEAGGVEENQAQIVDKVKKAREVAGGDNCRFETEMMRMGYLLNAEGSHGGSWLGNMGIWQFGIRRMGGQFFTEAIRHDGRLICPICGAEVGEGKNVCQKCGVKLGQGDIIK